jgi:cholesterol oxidase
MTTKGFDYDVVVIGSGFGGSVAAMRATEKGYRVGVMESGKRWNDEDLPHTSWDIRKFLWQPELEMYGIQRLEYLDDVFVLCGAGVGGGSHVYGNTLYTPPKKFFEATEWSGITDWADELAPYIDQAIRMLGVVRVPYMDTQVDRLCRDVAADMGVPKSYNKAPVGVYFGTPGVEADDPYFGGVGPRRHGCISCGNCFVGCGKNAKNKLNVNYLYLAEKFGAKIHELHEVYELKPLDGGGFEVLTRHPGWAQRAAHLHHHTYTAEQVIVSAHAYGSAKLLHHMRHKGILPGLSDQLGQLAPYELRGADHPETALRGVEARPRAAAHHPGLGLDHLGRVARCADEHRAVLLRCRQRPNGAALHLAPGGRPAASDPELAEGVRRAPAPGARHRRCPPLVRAYDGDALHADQ